MKPTWAGWPAVIESQNEDVTSHSPCLYIGKWMNDSRSWIPEVYDTGITWDFCSPIVTSMIEFIFSERISSAESDLWTPVGENSTVWTEVQYPH